MRAGNSTKIAARAISRFDVGAGKYRGHDIGLGLVAERQCHARTGLPGGATANGIHNDHHSGALLIARLSELSSDDGVDFCSGAKLANAEAGQLLAHGGNEEFGVCHNLTIIS